MVMTSQRRHEQTEQTVCLPDYHNVLRIVSDNIIGVLERQGILEVLEGATSLHDKLAVGIIDQLNF